MILKNKIYTTAELCDLEIYTEDFEFMDEPGEYIGQLLLRGSSYRRMLRLFFQLADGRKILTPVFQWQRFLGFMEAENGTWWRLTYVPGKDGLMKLSRAEQMASPDGAVLASNEFAPQIPLVRESPETP